MGKLKKHPLDKILEITGIIIILTCFIFVALNYSSLPESMPRHYGLDGKPDAFAGKGIVWILPVFGIFLYMIIGVISNIPSLINLPFKPEPEKLEYYHLKYARMIRILNVVVMCLFTFLTYQSIQIGFGNQTQLPRSFTAISLVLILGIPVYFILPDLIKAHKLKNQ